MLMNLKAPLQAGSQVPVTLVLRDAKGAERRVPVQVPVALRAPGAAAASSAAPAGGMHDQLGGGEHPLDRDERVAGPDAERPVPGRRHLYQAGDYDELADHPFELGAFWRGEFEVAGARHEFVVAGAWPGFDGERLLQDTRRIGHAVQHVFTAARIRRAAEAERLLDRHGAGSGWVRHYRAKARHAPRVSLARRVSQRLACWR